MSEERIFEHAATFEAGEMSGHVQVDRFEAYYEQLFAEVLEDGVITADERVELERAASALGLEPERLRRLEQALLVSYETRHKVRVREEIAPGDEVRPSLRGTDAERDAYIATLERRVKDLEARIVELENEVEEARNEAAVEIDVSGFVSHAAEETEDSATIHKRLRHDPRDVPTLHALFRAANRESDVDLAFRVAHALNWLGAAKDDERSVHDTYTTNGLIRPSTSLSGDLWRRSLYHPDQEVLTGEIFAVIAPAVLLGRVAALRRNKSLPNLAPEKRLDPKTSTVAVGRCFAWAATILGMPSPGVYADPEFVGGAEVVPNLPPALRVGKLALSGRSPTELAFLAGKHLAWFREDHFVRLLIPDVPDLEDVFLAALLIGSPSLPLHEAKKRQVEPIARAIEPLLESVQVDRLRGAFLRFVEEGGRTNLQRWATAVERTTTRAGFLLAGDLAVAERILTLEKTPDTAALLDDLIVFSTGDRYGSLRKRLGIAAGV
jgi:hypothetical protein